MDLDLNIKPKNVGTLLLYSVGFFLWRINESTNFKFDTKIHMFRKQWWKYLCLRIFFYPLSLSQNGREFTIEIQECCLILRCYSLGGFATAAKRIYSFKIWKKSFLGMKYKENAKKREYFLGPSKNFFCTKTVNKWKSHKMII